MSDPWAVFNPQPAPVSGGDGGGGDDWSAFNPQPAPIDPDADVPVDPVTGKKPFVVHLGAPRIEPQAAPPARTAWPQQGIPAPPGGPDFGAVQAGGTQPGPPGSQAGAFGTGVGKGLTLGWLPELTAALDPTSFTQAGEGDAQLQRFQQNRENERQREELMAKAYPGTTTAGELVGGVAGAALLPELAPFKAAEGAGLATRALGGLVNTAIPGAVYGGIAGAGAAQPGQGLQGAAQGALTGAVLGPVVGAAGAAIAPVVRGVSRYIPGLRPSAEQTAQEVVQRAVARDATDLPAAVQTMREAQAQGQDVTLADLGKKAIQAEAQKVARLSSEARSPTAEFLQTRQVGGEPTPQVQGPLGPPQGAPPVQPGAAIPVTGSSQAERVNQQIGTLMKEPQSGTIATRDTIRDRRSAEAETGYKGADATPIDYGAISGQKIEEALKKVPDHAKREANQIIGLRGGGGHQVVWAPNAKGELELSARPNTWQLRKIRQAIGDAANATRSAATGGRMTELGAAYAELRRELSDAMQEAVPKLKQADKKFADDSKLLKAHENGQKAFSTSKSPEAVKKEFSNLTEGEKEMYRHGYLDAVRTKVGNIRDTSDKTHSVLGTPALREKFNTIVPAGPARDQVTRALANEKKQFDLRTRLTGGSQTAELQRDLGSTADQVAEAIAHTAIHGGGLRALATAVLTRVSRLPPQNRAPVLAAVRDIILNPNPDAVEHFARIITEGKMPENTRQEIIAGVKRLLQAPVFQRPKSLMVTRPLLLQAGEASQVERDRQRRLRQ
jgi:hypothetical protein